MGKRIIATLLLLVLVFATVTTAFAKKKPASGTRYVISSNYKPVNVRKKPDKDAPLTAVASVPFNAQVTLRYVDQDKKGDNWYMIDYKGRTAGWMHGSYLKEKKHTHLYTKIISDITKPSGQRVVITECACGARMTRVYNKNNEGRLTQ